MKPAKFEYRQPGSLDETLEQLARYGPDARILAGGQSLVPLLNFRILQPAALISINHCAPLDYLRDEGSFIECGAGLRQMAAERSEVVRRKAPLLAAALPWVGGIANRNRGTVCGSLAHADPLAELPAVALALDAKFILNGVAGRRGVDARDFFVGDLATVIEPGEMLEAVRFPACGARTGAAFVELGNRAHGFAVAGVAAHLEFDDVGRCIVARIAAIGVGSTPIRLSRSEAALKGMYRFDDAVKEAAAIAVDGLDPTSGFHADAAYKRDVIGPLVQRALQQARAVYAAQPGTLR